jgi:L-ascorbate metabolism protein UlaG (beta-lactamase superfamily)
MHVSREDVMRFTKLEHACVRLEKDGAVLVIDPGVWAGPDALAGAGSVLITHEHFDHLNVDGLRAALAADPGLKVWANASVAGQFGEFSGQFHVINHGDTFDADGFDVAVYGQEHAVLHRDIPLVPNTGFMIDGEVFHPGDALTLPQDPVPVLLLPVNAPWLKLSEMIDYARAVDAGRGYAIHDGLLNERAIGVLGNWLPLATGPGGGTITRLDPGTTITL